MNVYDIAIAGLEGSPATVLDEQRGRATLIVNVASRCGLTPQYDGLVALADRYGLPYNKGPLSKQFGSVVRRIFRLSLPSRAPQLEAVAA